MASCAQVLTTDMHLAHSRLDTTRATRQNHYAALLFYLQVSLRLQPFGFDLWQMAGQGDSEHWVYRAGDRFMDAVCRDASDGERKQRES